MAEAAEGDAPPPVAAVPYALPPPVVEEAVVEVAPQPQAVVAEEPEHKPRAADVAAAEEPSRRPQGLLRRRP